MEGTMNNRGSCRFSGLIYRLAMPPLTFLVLIAALTGCAPVISTEVLDTVDRGIDFNMLTKDPERYKGSIVLLGGTIVDVENLEDRTVLEVLQQPLNMSMRPVRPEDTQGRFLVIFDEFKDPAVYGPGRKITVAGALKGTVEKTLGKMPYTYPEISPKGHHLWGPYRGPGFSVGVGVFGSF